jgi:hypothetical protein
MNANGWICTNISKHDPALLDYLKKFHDVYKELDEQSFAEKLKNDPVFYLLTVNTNLKHVKRTSMWINFWSILYIICFIILIFAAIGFYAK